MVPDGPTTSRRRSVGATRRGVTVKPPGPGAAKIRVFTASGPGGGSGSTGYRSVSVFV